MKFEFYGREKELGLLDQHTVDGKVAEVGAPEKLEQKAGAFWSLYFGQGSQLGSATR